jgi:hypothetical protein
MGSYSAASDALDIFVTGDYAYLTDQSNGNLLLLDISDPTSPTLLDSLSTPENMNTVIVEGEYAYVGNAEAGLQVVKVARSMSIPLFAGTYDTPGDARDVTVAGDYAFVADYGSGLQVIDILDPTNPTLLGTYDTPGLAIDVTVSGDYAFVADYGFGLQVIDISDPTNPTLLGTYDTPDLAYGVTVAGDYAFVADRASGLQVIMVFQREVKLDNNVGRSLFVDAADDTIFLARLTTTQTDSVDWELSADGGVSWQGILPGASWDRMDVPGADLLWRSTLIWSPGVVNPTVSNLTLEWLYEFAPITSVTDIPNDQGKQVRVEWRRSGHDFIGDSQQIVEYAVYREIDPDLTLSEQRLDSQKFLGATDAVVVHAQMMLSAGWDFITTVPVRVEDDYAVVAPTLADTTIVGGEYFTTFMVTALTAIPGVFFDSPPESGFSVDNLAPGVPQSILAGYQSTGVSLTWDEALEEDFQFYRIYRGADPGFTPSPENLIHETAAPAWIDPSANPWGYHYKITALDFAGNESEAGSPTEVTGVQDGTVPARTALLGAVPNPFNPSTKLSYEMAFAGHVRLKVYDPAGRLVTTLVNERRDAGLHEVIWDGRDHAGRMSSAGVYLYRLEVGDFIETKRMTLIK